MSLKTHADIQREGADQTRPWLFLGLTLGLSWALGFLAAGIQQEVGAGLVLTLRYLSGLTPFALAAALIHLKGDRTLQRGFWKRIVDFRRISPFWYLVVFGFVPIKAGLAASLDLLLGGTGITLDEATQFLVNPISILPTLFFWLVFGPLPEEPGWRGYALEGLQERRGPIASSVVIGLVWALWHVPLFLIQDSWQAVEIGFFTQRFWLYMLNIMLDSFVYTWIYNRTDRSILAGVLFHFSVNAFGEAFALSPRAEVFSSLIVSLVAALLIKAWLRQKRSNLD